MSNCKTQVSELSDDNKQPVPELSSKIIQYILKITNTQKIDEHPDSVCHHDTHSDGGHHDSHSDTHPDCSKRGLLGDDDE